ncbi:hypothetical protein CYMTET_49779 [Cymbomonas tetramitiformis]|uniref:Uncharacterized protein n=1 Tax=Cymbomonas tetramitiformis TaxID=36881 RepID=A0AAE0BPJ2_9CHLO|nr:hypothetical protein CYMTET_49779 [Cymbomonas tetramitiformis]
MPPDKFQDAENKVDAGASERVSSRSCLRLYHSSPRKCPLSLFLDVNPYPKRPKNLEFGDMPVLYDMYGTRTFDQRAKKPNSSLYYEYKPLAPMVSVLFGSEQVQAQIHELDD